MKDAFFLKEMGLILIIKLVLLLTVWWTFFSDQRTVDNAHFANRVFGEELRETK